MLFKPSRSCQAASRGSPLCFPSRRVPPHSGVQRTCCSATIVDGDTNSSDELLLAPLWLGPIACMTVHGSITSVICSVPGTSFRGRSVPAEGSTAAWGRRSATRADGSPEAAREHRGRVLRACRVSGGTASIDRNIQPPRPRAYPAARYVALIDSHVNSSPIPRAGCRLPYGRCPS